LAAEGVLARLAQRLAPALEDLAERPLVGAVAEESLVVLQLDVVAFNFDGGQPGGAVCDP
jgi:hypothetical protein